MIDYYNLRTTIKQQLLHYSQIINVDDDALPWAWIVRAFSSEGGAINPILSQALDKGRRWLTDPQSWHRDLNLGGIGLSYPLFSQSDRDQWQPEVQYLIQKVKLLRSQGVGKFSKLNDPDIVFGLAFIAREVFPEDLLAWLRDHAIRSASTANLRRAMLFSAAAFEMRGTVTPLAFNINDLQVYECIVAFWFIERYPTLVDGEQRRQDVLQAFERLRDDMTFEEGGQGISPQYVASPIDLAMLYEAVVQRTREGDYVTLFNNIAWHPEIRNAAQSLFLKGEWAMAVFQASVTFIDAVKQRAGHPKDSKGKPLDGAKLMETVFASKPPKLRFNNLTSQPEQNEQRGLALIAEGIVSALRNPKGHLPQATIVLTAQDALEQLAIISYLMRRLDNAQP